MVATPHYLASAAGLRVLHAGGNAIDAAIAAAAVCSVVYPHMCSIGGDAVWLIYNAQTATVHGLNGSGRSGSQCSIDRYEQSGYATIPSRGFFAANTVPGAVDSWGTAYAYGQEHFGTCVSWASLLEDAVAYAEAGFAVTQSQERWTIRDTMEPGNALGMLQQFEGFRRTYLTASGVPYRAGERLRQPALAQTLKAIASQGSREFYEGAVARAMVQYLVQHQGMLTAEDFRAQQAEWVHPLHTTYRGYDAYGLPPNTQGLTALQLLNLLEHFDVASIGDEHPDYYHVHIEATKLAFADRDRWITDPDFQPVPVAHLLSPAYARQRASLIDMQRASPHYPAGSIPGDTVYIAVVDTAGHAVSMLQSLYFDFGSGIVAGETGVLLQNRGSFFSLNRGHVNRLAPRKRTFHTLIPAMLLQQGRLALVYGTMGGEGQPQTQAALVSRIVDFGYDVQAAIEAPRWLYGRTWGMATGDLCLEGRMPSSTVQELARRGHPVRVVAPWDELLGHAQAIRIDPATGVRQGGADPRGDGLAVGY
jgi:gamma-glutamyltranspeptidase/glutathione hydrolase